MYATQSEFASKQATRAGRAAWAGCFRTGSRQPDSITFPELSPDRDAMLRLHADHRLHRHFSRPEIDLTAKLTDASKEAPTKSTKKRVSSL